MKPYVLMNMAMSADGKISTRRRESMTLGSPQDRLLMDLLRAQADAVVVGSRTVRLDGWAIRIRNPEIRARRVNEGRSPHPVNVVLSSRLDFRPRGTFFTHTATEKLVITSRAAPRRKVAAFGRHADVVVLPGTRVTPRRALAVLARRGCRRVLVEGGGALNFSFFKENLVDEIYITVTPRIIGGEAAPTVVDGRGFLKAACVRLALVSVRRKGGEVFLRYRVLKG